MNAQVNNSWHGDADLKAKALAGYDLHIKADTLVKGAYFDGAGETFRGCHIGCVVTDLGGSSEGSHSKEYERVTGNPEWLASLTEHFFESMPNPQNQTVTRAIMEATPVGKDLTPVYHRFMIWLLADEKHGTIQDCDDAGRSITESVVALHVRAAAGDYPSDGEWASAEAAAWYAARGATVVGAGEVAEAAALDAAWVATRAAASAAGAAALATAGAAAWDAQSEQLIKLLRDA